MIARIAVRVGPGHTMPACRTPAEFAEALRTLADEILRDEPAPNEAFDRAHWPRLVRTADGGWAGHAWLSAEDFDAAPDAPNAP